MPTVQRKDLDSTSAILTVTVQRDELKPKVDAELKRLRQRAAIKGFRQGQAPASYIKQMYGHSLFADQLNELLSKELYDYLRSSGLEVLGQPLPTENERNFSFSMDSTDPEYAVEYEVGFVPPFEVQGLGPGEPYERLTIANLDELADADLDHARMRMGKRSNPEDDIQENDIVSIAATEEGGDYATTITVLLKEMSESDFKAELLTKKKGDTVRFNARDLEKRHDEKKYRKYILQLDEDDDRAVGDWFTGTIEEVSRVGKAELDEEFFTNYFGDGVTNEAEALDTIKNGIAQFYEMRSNALLMREMQRRLLEQNPIELPGRFLQRWLLVNNRDTLTADSVAREYPAFAENLRWSMLSDRVKAQSGIEVGPEEVKAEYRRRVLDYFKAELPENVIDSYVDGMMKNQKDVEKVQADLEYDKIFEAIRSVVTIVDKLISSTEFQQIFDSFSKKAEEEQTADAMLREAVEE